MARDGADEACGKAASEELRASEDLHAHGVATPQDVALVRAPPSGADRARARRRGDLPRVRALGRPERRSGRERRDRRDRLGGLPGPGRARAARCADRRPQRPRVDQAVPRRPRRRRDRSDADARHRARWTRRRGPRLAVRARSRDGRRDDPRCPPHDRRAPLPHRRIARRAPPTLGPRCPPRLDARAARAAARGGGDAGSQDAPRTRPRAAGRRRPGLPRPRRRDAARAARRDALRGRPGPEEDTQQSLFTVVPAEPAPDRLPERSLLRKSKPSTGQNTDADEADRRGARAVPRELRRRGDRRRRDLRPARHPLRAAARTRDEGGEGRRS